MIRFFVLVFALAVPFWLLGAVLTPPDDFPIRLPLTALQLVCPFVAAAILVYRDEGVAGIASLLKRVVSYRRIGPIWYVPIIFLMPAIYLLTYTVQRMLGRSLPDWQIQPVAVVTLFIVFFIAAVAEESGWTGYVFDPMQARWGAALAAIVLGVVWALFHLVADLQGDHDLAWIGWQRLGGCALRILIAWVYNNTGRSVLAAVLLHTVDNLSWQLTPVGGSHYDPALNAPVTAAVAVIVTYLWGPRTLARFRYARSSAKEVSRPSHR